MKWTIAPWSRRRSRLAPFAAAPTCRCSRAPRGALGRAIMPQSAAEHQRLQAGKCMMRRHSGDIVRPYLRSIEAMSAELHRRGVETKSDRAFRHGVPSHRDAKRYHEIRGGLAQQRVRDVDGERERAREKARLGGGGRPDVACRELRAENRVANRARPAAEHRPSCLALASCAPCGSPPTVSTPKSPTCFCAA